MGQIDEFNRFAFTHDTQSHAELGNGGLRGQFLIAMPSLRDPVFAHTITYICDHSASGAIGIVINHPLDICVSDIFEQLELSITGRLANDKVLSGGPVQMDRGFVLHPSDFFYESTINVSPDVSLTASRDVLDDMANNSGPGKAVVALGYAGWDAGQLEDEILANAWLTVPADKHILFDTPSEQRWAAASKYLGIDLNLIHGTAGHA